MLVLLSGDAQKNRERLVDELEVCIKSPETKKITYLVKEPALRQRVQEMLALRGHLALVPNPILTNDGFFGVAKDSVIQPILAELLMQRAIESPELEAFTNVSSARISRYILAFVKELKLAGIDSDRFAKALIGELDTAKNRDLAKIYNEFEAILLAQDIHLREELIWQKINKFDSLKRNNIIVFDGYYSLDPIVKEVLLYLKEQKQITTYINFPYFPNEVFSSLVEDYKWLKKLADTEEIAPERPVQSTIYEYRPQNTDSEIRFVLKKIKELYYEKKITSTDDVVIISSNPTQYRPIMQRLCEREQLPFRPGPLPLSKTAIVREIKLLVGFLTRPLSIEEMLALLSGKYFDFSFYLPQGLTKARLASLLQRIKLTGKSDNWPRKLKRMAKDNKECGLILTALNNLNFNLKLPSYGTAQGISAVFLDILNNLKTADLLLQDVGEDLEKIIELRAWMEIKNSLTTLETAFTDTILGSEEWQSKEYLLAWLRNILSSTINISKDGLSISKFNEAPHLQGKYLFVLGVNEEELPSQIRESWLFNDNERRLLKTQSNINLVEANYREKLQDYLYWEALRSCNEATWLLSPREIGGKVREESRYVDELSLFGAYFDEKNKVTVTPFYTSEEELLEYLAAYNPDKLPAPLIEKTVRLTEINKRPYIYSELGYLKGTVAKDGYSISVSAFSEYASCPYRFFVHRVLGIRETDEISEEVTALDGGILWHKVLELIYKEVREKGKEKVASELETKLREIATNVFNDNKASEIFKQVEFEKYYSSIKQLIEEDLTRAYSKPVYLELNFGSGEEWPAVKLGPYELKGKIDRVDQISDGERTGYLVYDYKRSNHGVGEVEKGKDFQLTAYIEALRKSGLKVLGGAYLSFKGKENRLWSKEAYQVSQARTTKNLLAEADWNAFLDELLNQGQILGDQLFAGEYTPDYNSKGCSYCSFKALCRKDTRGGDLDNE